VKVLKRRPGAARRRPSPLRPMERPARRNQNGGRTTETRAQVKALPWLSRDGHVAGAPPRVGGSRVSRKKICIDGFNIAMPQGSGIATYARNLNHALRALGHQTQILYGPAQGPCRDPLLTEIALVDAIPPSSPQWTKLGSYLRRSTPRF